MKNLLELKENAFLTDKYFPLKIFLNASYSEDILYTHWHEYLEIIYMTKGQATFNFGGQVIEASEGDILFVNSGQIHSGSSSNESPVNFYAIVFDQSLLSSQSPDPVHIKHIVPFLQGKYLFPNKITKAHENYSVFHTYLQLLITEFHEKKPGYELMIKSFLSFLTILIFRDYYAIDNLKNNSSVYEKHIDNFKKLISYIEQHLSEKLTIEEAAQIVSLSPFHFCKLFKKITGRTFIEFVNLYRINEAEQLLQNTEMSITEISEKLGFCNINYFDKVFKQYKKYSPSICRKLF